MLNLLFIILSSSAIGEDVLKIYTLIYEFFDSAVREANPPVNAGDLSSVDGPVGWRRRLSTAPRASRDRSVSSWTLGDEVTGVSLLPRSPEGRAEQMVKRKMSRVSKQGLVAPWISRLLHKRRAPRSASRRLLRF